LALYSRSRAQNPGYLKCDRYIQQALYTSLNPEDSVSLATGTIVSDTPVYYTLMNTEAEPVPEPLTAGGTALAFAGLSWLKHKKKMAV
ncbi:PEP-CTERM sorting domain-containing protein, partial [Microcoleus sp. Pol11C3]|uniref:PEP-CTERM sorting domain-containing protein n=1 Tax=Microcoleus sp. Pol11C3 TaxID=3055390 RepID=UPI002FD5FB5F